jgi:hypothetical protein
VRIKVVEWPHCARRLGEQVFAARRALQLQFSECFEGLPRKSRCAGPRSSFRAPAPAPSSNRRRTNGVRSTLTAERPSLLPARRDCAARIEACSPRRSVGEMSRFADSGLDGNRPSLCLLQVGKRSALRLTSFGSHLHAISDLLCAR